MKDVLESYRRAGGKLPETMLAWRLYGAGLESFGRNGRPEAVRMPRYGPDELLLRVDAVGICFSDVKVINQGNQHPRVAGRDLAVDPVTLGHEASVTVVGVGDSLKDKFAVGQRFIVQADVFVNGKNLAFGYALPGAQTQYQVVGREILAGDEGCYLLPVQDATGYGEAALAEPWACVVASYRVGRRTSIKPDGVLWLIGGKGNDGDCTLGMPISARTVIATGLSGKILDEIASQASSGRFELVRTPHFDELDVNALARSCGGFDDIVVLGPDAERVEKSARCLNPGGILSLLASEAMPGPVEVDIGKVHYQNHAYLGTTSRSVSEAYAPVRIPSELKANGRAWFVGAGGPMGQMHLQRAVEMQAGPSKILVTEIDAGRIESVRKRFTAGAGRKGIELRVVNPNGTGKDAFSGLVRDLTDGEGFDDIVVLAPAASLVEDAIAFAGKECLINIFAGVPIGAIASLDLTGVYLSRVRLVGSSGSRVADLRDTLAATESGELSTNASVAAIGGIEASWDGMKAVKENRFPGRIVIYPHIRGLGLTALPDLKKRLPSVYAQLTEGLYWNRDAEEELLRRMLRMSEG